ncbi:hypothetical protein XU18_0679 [Perkinsela sp. CCAP 1560/4]|nr:hypothetical protein XU18_0679 [Perkinsela sp. CCAP 1560/4]|eukprot:KNH09001.1 hypothetical protein XU18_0679 [Perkinsela sp. CCAP 1560/4]
MLALSRFLYRHGQYKTRLKVRRVGFIPSVIRRKIRGAFIALRSQANSGAFISYLKSDEEIKDSASGRKLSQVCYDRVLDRSCVFSETKLKGPFLLKSHMQSMK